MTGFLFHILGLLIPAAHAQNSAWSKYCTIFSSNCGDGTRLIEDAAGRVAMIALSVLGGAAVISVMVAGIKLTFQGESGKEQAKTIITYAALGLTLGVGSWSIIRLVYNAIATVNAW